MSDLTAPPSGPLTPPAAVPVAGSAPRRRSAFAAIYRLQLRLLATPARIVLLGGMGLLGMLVAWLVGNNTAAFRQVVVGTNLLNEFGLWLLVPVPTLVFASAALGDPTDDKTLVYLWLRPVGRSKIVLASALAAFTLSWPLVVPALAASAWLTGAGSALVGSVVLAGTVTMVAYVGLFVALGLRVRWPLAWGLLYVIIWEGFVARGSTTAAKLAMRAYGSSILHDRTGTELLTSDIDATWSVIVPLVVGVAFLAYAAFRLRRQDVD